MKCVVCGTSMVAQEFCQSTVAGYRSDSEAESKREPIFDLQLEFCPVCHLLSQRPFTEAGILLDKLYEEHESTQHSLKGPSEYFRKFVSLIAKNYQLNAVREFRKSAAIAEPCWSCFAMRPVRK